MAFLETVLFPIIWLFRQIIDILYALSGNYGLAIIGLSLIVALATYPLAGYGRRAEMRHKSIIDAMTPEIDAAKASFKGEERFHAIDAIYQKHKYHPIHSISTISGFALQIPFLLSSLVLLISYPPLEGQSFLLIDDISKPDQLLSIAGLGINVLPLVMTVLALGEAMIKPEMDTGSRNRFFLVSLGLLVIVYPLPAAVVLYWTANNVWSFLRSLRASGKSPDDLAPITDA